MVILVVLWTWVLWWWVPNSAAVPLAATADIYVKGTVGQMTYVGHVAVIETTKVGWAVSGFTPCGARIYGGGSNHSDQFALIVYNTALQGGAIMPAYFLVGWRSHIPHQHLFMAYDFVTGSWFTGNWVWR